jgi:branched-chain amino acid transport system ATP-binding protein
MLALNAVDVVYDGVILVLKGVSLQVPQGEITTLLGANGAGKTTALKAISGVLRAERGQVAAGSITLGDLRLDHLPAHEVVRHGVVQVFEGRRVFEHLTVEENLVVGGHVQTSTAAIRRGIDLAFAYFPILAERRRQLAGYLSGGEQQMLAIGRALLSNPRVVMLDEPSLGLAPQIVEHIFSIILRLRQEQGLTVLLVEQNAALALEVADHGYVIENGRIVLAGPAPALRQNRQIQEPRPERDRHPPILPGHPTAPPPPLGHLKRREGERSPVSARRIKDFSGSLQFDPLAAATAGHRMGPLHATKVVVPLAEGRRHLTAVGEHCAVTVEYQTRSARERAALQHLREFVGAGG